MQDNNEERRYEVWVEGWKGMGDEGTPAFYLGAVYARSFNEAIILATTYDRDHGGNLLEEKYLNLSKEPYTYWGCRFFDNEKDARKLFG